MKKILLKPLSTNEAWCGRKFSTPKKKIYERHLRMLLRGCVLEGKPPFSIHFRFHISQMQDYDNAIKCSQDVICSFFKINDRDIHRALIEKIPVKKGKEHFEFDISSLYEQKTV